ncbi:MerR family transcriptional regulator [Lysinibacillus sphaericus OT4b.31]|uniref:MerR family transcriptional regulator n=1 Tax=Lysinibacillus sphaericus OT4b.31 TaxID=1285586 RepID=R7Z7U2_LYSSH|nr:MerR family transcriptional regulator [Lysinibacillus sphaericus OT4b.31]
MARIERGEKNIKLQTLEKLALGLEVSPYTILLFNEISNPEQHFRNDELLKILNGRLINRSETEIKMVLKVVDEILKALDN